MALTQTVSSTDVTVQGDISISQQTVKIAEATTSGASGNANVYTVPVGKKATIVAMSLQASAFGINGGNNTNLDIDGTVILRAAVPTLATTGATSCQNVNLSYECGIPMAAGEALDVNTSGTANCAAKAFIAYVEEDA